jgi:diguanylate cyclase (GGDEF)-like protein
MNISNDSTENNSHDQQKRADQQNDVTAAGIASEEAMSSREKSVEAREDVSHAREETADQRDSAAQAREEALHLRETVASSRETVALSRETIALSREKTIEEADALEAALVHHITRLREANEHLVITTVQAHAMAEEIQKAKDKMGYMAHHDFLTDLPNRLLLRERLVQAIAWSKRHGTKLAVLFMDLDRFKTINDSLGHAVGDMMLQSVAQRLKSAVRSTDTVSRQGGDEFVVLLPEVEGEKSVAAVAGKICKAVSAPYALAGQDLHIGATIGISIYPEDGEDAETLIMNADVAMYHAKDRGRGRYHFYRQEMNARAVERQRTEGDLHRALEQQEFQLYYQAQIDLRTHNIIGVEALIRWRHPIRGLLLPGMFVPIAEECGAIVPIGRWVLHEACRQTQAWLNEGLMLDMVAVNISAIEFEKEGFFENVRTVLRDTGLAPHHLELELTESVLMENAQSSMTMLQELKTMGVKIAVDDFGTGYSSLSYLKQFPVDTLKIDRSFVADIVADSDDDILVESVISLGKSLRHRVIAEGIETPEQLAFLSDHHCAEGQGFYLSRPMIAEDFSALLKSGVSADLFHRSTSLG